MKLDKFKLHVFDVQLQVIHRIFLAECVSMEDDCLVVRITSKDLWRCAAPDLKDAVDAMASIDVEFRIFVV